MKKKTTPLIIRGFLFVFMLLCFKLNAQDRTFATTIIDQDYVTNPNQAINGNLENYAEVRANSGTLIIGAYDGTLKVGFNGELPANTTSYIKIKTQDDLLPTLLGGSLGNLLSDVLGSVLIGNQEFTVAAYNDNTKVLSAVSSDPNTFSGSRAKVLSDDQGNYYIALTPDQSYNSIRITNHMGSLLGLNQERFLQVYGVFHGNIAPACGKPSFTSYDGNGLNLDLLKLGGAGVTNIENALDGDKSTHSELSLGILGVAASIEQTIYFENASQADEDFKLRLAVDPSLLALGVANNIEFDAFNGANLVATTDLNSLLNVELLNLLQSNDPVDVPFDVSAPADRIVVRYTALLNTSVSQRLDLYDVAITSAIPEIDVASQNIIVCAESVTDLVATSATSDAQIRWYDSKMGGTLLATVANGDPFTTPVLTEDTTFYAASVAPGCTEESARVAVTVNVNQLPQASDIVVAGLDLPICIPDILSIVPTSTISGNFNFYLDENRTLPIIDGYIEGDLTFNINTNNELEITGLTASDSPYTIYVSVIDPVTGCENKPGELARVNIELNSGPDVTITLNENITSDDIINTAEAAGDITISGAVTGDAKSGDTVTLTINDTEYTAQVVSDLSFATTVPGVELLADADHIVEAEITVTDLLCSTTATDSASYETDAVSPTIPTVNDQTTSDQTPTITGTADTADDLTVTVNGITYAEGDANLSDNGDDTWSLTIPAVDALGDGIYDVIADATDTAGNSAVDITSDELTINSAAPQSPTVDFLVTADTTPTITGTLDSSTSLTVVINGITYTEADGNLTDNGDDTWSLTIPVINVLSDGVYDVMATAEDDFGNVAADNTSDELTIDITAPTTPTVIAQVSDDPTPLIKGTADSADDLTVEVNGAIYTEGDGNLTDNGDGTWSLQIPDADSLPDGTFDVVATATDAAGNSATDGTTDELTIDTMAPTTPTVTAQITNDPTPTITGTANTVDNLTVTVNGVTYAEGDGNLIDNGDNSWILNIPDGNILPDDIYDVKANVTDVAGNSATDNTTDELTIDTMAPTIPTVTAQITNDSTPTITGTANTVDNLTVTVNGVTYAEGDGNLIDNGDNSWILNIPDGNILPDDIYDVKANVTDVAGNSATDNTTDELTIDTMAPTTPTVTAQITNDPTPTITGTANTVDNLTVTVNGVTYAEGDGNLIDNGDNSWILNIPDGNILPDDIYDVKANVTDAAGNSATDNTTDELTIDTMAPTIPTVTAQITNDPTPLIEGTADSADDLTVEVNGAIYTEGDGNLTDNGDGTWSLQIPDGDSLPDGIYDVKANATDAAGNSATDGTTDELTIDTMAPTTPTVTDQITNDPTPLIEGTADSADDLTVEVNGAIYTEGDGNLTDNGDDTWNLQIPDGDSLPDGTFDVVATATDAAGNSATDGTTDELTIDTMAPTIPTVTAQITNDPTPLIEGTADSADDLTVEVNGTIYTEGDGNLTDNGDGTWSLQIPDGNILPDDIYDVKANVTDVAGNSATDNTTDELTIDTMAPTIPTVTAQITNDPTPLIEGTADSADDLTVEVNGTIYTEGDGNLTDNGDGTWSLQIPDGDSLPDGIYDVIATATDAAGNTANDGSTDELAIDTMSPTIPTVDMLTTTDVTPMLTGTADFDADLTVEVDGVSYTKGDGNLTAQNNNTWDLQIADDHALEDGTYEVVATSTDDLGNRAIDITTDELVISLGTPTTNNTDQDFCAASNPTIANIDVNEPNIKWYVSATGGTALTEGTILIDDTTYYAALQGTNTESPQRLAVHVNVTTVPTPTAVSVAQSFCSNENATIADISINENGVIWYAQATGGTPLADDALLIDGTTYYAALTANGCESALRLAVAIAVNELVTATITSSQNVPCFEKEITYTTQSGMSNYMWTVTNGGMIVAGGTNTDDSITVVWDELGAQSVSVSYESDNACMAIGEATLDVTVTSCSDLTITKNVNNLNPMIGAEISYTITVSNTGETDIKDIEVDETLPSGLLYVNFTAEAGTYNNVSGKWNIPEISAGATLTLEVVVSVLDIGTYLNVASIVSSNPIDSNTDNNVAQIEIDPNCLKVFNEFSPNGDGNNDKFAIQCIEKYPQNVLKIYNRAGNLVYQMDGYDNSWDGCANAGGAINRKSGLPSATYFYVLNINDGSPAITGWVYIAR